MELKHLLSEFDKQALEDVKTLAKSLEDTKVEDEESKDVVEEEEVKPESEDKVEEEAKVEAEEATAEPETEEVKAEEAKVEEVTAEPEAEEAKAEEAELEETASKSIDKADKEKEAKKEDKDAEEEEEEEESESDDDDEDDKKKDDKEEAKKSTEVVDEFSRKSIEEISDVVKGLAAIVGSVLKAVQATANTSTEARKSIDDLKVQIGSRKVEDADLDVVEKSVTMPVTTKELASDVVAKSDEDQEETVTVAEPTVEVEAEVTEDTAKPEENAEQEVVKAPKEAEDKKDVFAENRDAFMTKFKKASQDGSVSRGTLQELRTIYGAVQQGQATEKEIARFVEFSK